MFLATPARNDRIFMLFYQSLCALASESLKLNKMLFQRNVSLQLIFRFDGTGFAETARNFDWDET